LVSQHGLANLPPADAFSHFESIMRRRVVITGMGLINPLGTDVPTVWEALLKGKSGVGYTTLFDASRYPTKISAEVKNWDFTGSQDDARRWKYRGRHSRFAAGAAMQAVQQSGISADQMDPTRMGVYLGAGEGNQEVGIFLDVIDRSIRTDRALSEADFTRNCLDRLNPATELEQEPNMPAAHLAGLFGAQGPNMNCLTACAASSQAIGEATEMIRRGDVDVMLAGGAHSMIHPFGVTGFNLLTALSTNNENPTGASRPFDRLRDGFVLGEGGGMVVLEDLELAKKRGANILGEVLGYGTTSDAFRITDIHPEGRGAIGCITMALNDAKVSTTDVDYINAHGTSTSINDRVESLACREVFGANGNKIPPVSSTKSMMGHLIAAAGVTEMIVCLLAIRDRVLPPTINYENPDPDCNLDYIPNQCREAKCDIALNNSFGFGGQNISVVVGKYKD
jgi:3-oxoacyl-[acyl-carrier-protein] synthase II